MIDYLRDPKAIYAESFRQIEGELAARGVALNPVATRVIHSCGMIDILDDLEISPGAIQAGQAAILAQKPVLCDCEMVARGLIMRGPMSGRNPLVTLNDSKVPELAKTLGTTRSAAAVELWQDQIAGALVVIGNAPTALFHLLERLESGWPKPALMLHENQL